MSERWREEKGQVLKGLSLNVRSFLIKLDFHSNERSFLNVREEQATYAKHRSPARLRSLKSDIF